MKIISSFCFCALLMISVFGCVESLSPGSQTENPNDHSTSPSPSQQTTEGSKCGNTTREGYLTPYNANISAIYRIENVTSKAGFTCIVDTCVSKTSPKNLSEDQSCENDRRTSTCYLENIGLMDSVEDAIPSGDFTTLIGNMEAVSICSPGESCKSKSESCIVCENETIFVPCGYQLK